MTKQNVPRETYKATATWAERNFGPGGQTVELFRATFTGMLCGLAPERVRVQLVRRTKAEIDGTCSRCHTNPRNGQDFYCSSCRREYRRAWRNSYTTSRSTRK